MARYPAILTHAARVLAIALAGLFFATLPGAALRPLVIEWLPPPLPPHPDRDATLDVRVTAALSQRAVAHARVQAISLVLGKAYVAGLADTDALGAAKLTGLPRGELWVLVQAPGFARASRQIVLGQGAGSIDVALAGEHRLEVVVVDEGGGPLPDAEVEVQGADPLPLGARAGADGQAVVGRLGPPPWIVTARCAGFDAVTRRGVREGPERIVLQKLGAIVARVTSEAGTPAEGAEVRIEGTSLWPARSATTRADGSVRVSGLLAGSYALRASKGGSVSAIELGVVLARGEEKTVALGLAPGVSVAVHVAEETAEGAAPIAGARISLAEGGLSPFPLEAVTDKAGDVRIGPVSPGDATVLATADGFLSGARSIQASPRTVVPLVLVRSGTLLGRVVDARGFSIAGATLEIVGTDTAGFPVDDDPRRAQFQEAHFTSSLGGPRPLLSSGELGVVPGPVPPIPRRESSPPVPTLPGRSAPLEPWVTRGDGTFRLAPVSPGRVRAIVRHPEYVETVSETVSLSSGGEIRLDVVMRRGGTLDGRVVDARGVPVFGASVSIAAVRGSLERETRTATDGSFAFAALPDEVTVTVSQGGEEASEASIREAITVPDGTTRSLTLILAAARPDVSLRVNDDRGFPIDESQVTVSSLDPRAPLRATVFTDARGEAKVHGAGGLPLSIEARAPSHAPKVLTVAQAGELVVVALDPGEQITGRVRTQRGGNPVAGAEIALSTSTGTVHAITDRQGGFTLGDLAAGSAHLRVRAPLHAPARVELSLPSGSSHETVLPVIELADEAVAEGVVLDARGQPVAGARVAEDRVPIYLAVGPTPAGMALTDAAGRFHLGELGEGSVALEAYAPGVGRGRAEGVTLSAGRSTGRVKIVLEGANGDKRTAEDRSAGGVAVTLGETGGDVPAVVIVAVADGSEAERAGISPGDVIVDIDGAPVRGMADARSKLGGPLVDDVVVHLRRGDRDFTSRIAREAVRR